MNQIPKSTLVPAHFFNEKDPRCFLSEIFELDDADVVEYENVPQYGAVLVYVSTPGCRPEILSVLENLENCSEYCKIVASLVNGILYLAIAQGKNLQFCNSFVAPDFTTAEYYIFNAVKSLQINPEISSISFLSPLSVGDEESLYRYFKSVEQL